MTDNDESPPSTKSILIAGFPRRNATVGLHTHVSPTSPDWH